MVQHKLKCYLKDSFCVTRVSCLPFLITFLWYYVLYKSCVEMIK